MWIGLGEAVDERPRKILCLLETIDSAEPKLIWASVAFTRGGSVRFLTAKGLTSLWSASSGFSSRWATVVAASSLILVSEASLEFLRKAKKSWTSCRAVAFEAEHELLHGIADQQAAGEHNKVLGRLSVVKDGKGQLARAFLADKEAIVEEEECRRHPLAFLHLNHHCDFLQQLSLFVLWQW